MFFVGCQQTVLYFQEGRCAQYLEFWYRGVSDPGDESEGLLGVFYSDNTWFTKGLDESAEWAFVHVNLDTSKLVKEVEVEVSDTEVWLDDFDLEACPAPVGAVGGEVIMPIPIVSPVMLIAVIAAASVLALGYRFTRK